MISGLSREVRAEPTSFAGKLFCFVLLVGLLAGPQARSEDVTIVKDKNIVQLLLYPFVVNTLKKQNYYVRIVKIHEAGECSEGKSHCPKQWLTIGLSSFDEYPDNIAFRSPAAHVWDSLEWIKTSYDESKTDKLSFKIRRTDYVKAGDSNLPKHRYYLVEFNYHTASMAVVVGE